MPIAPAIFERPFQLLSLFDTKKKPALKRERALQFLRRSLLLARLGRLGIRRLGFFGGGGFRFWFNYNREVHPFEDRAFSSVALALVQTNDSSVTTVAFFLCGSNFVEQNFYRVLLMKTRDGQTPIMDSAAL